MLSLTKLLQECKRYGIPTKSLNQTTNLVRQKINNEKYNNTK